MSRCRGLLAAAALCCGLTPAVSAVAGEAPLVIAHRGASAYLPEHTLAAKAVAHAMGADFIEQDVVLSRDGVPIVLHDIYLDSTTDVADRFPDRARADGHFYAIDFSLEELRRLRLHERRQADGSNVFADRFPRGSGLFPIATLAEEIALIEGLNRSRPHSAGLYIEMKGTAFHRSEGQDLPAAVMEVLKASGWDQRSELVYLQSFEPDALRYLRDELHTVLPLIQLIGENAWNEDGEVDYDAMRSDAGLDAVAAYADGIGPFLMQLYRIDRDSGATISSGLVERAHARGLKVHPYTLRADQLPPGIQSFDALHELLLEQLRVDGVFSDFPDRSRAFVDALGRLGLQTP